MCLTTITEKENKVLISSFPNRALVQCYLWEMGSDLPWGQIHSGSLFIVAQTWTKIFLSIRKPVEFWKLNQRRKPAQYLTVSHAPWDSSCESARVNLFCVSVLPSQENKRREEVTRHVTFDYRRHTVPYPGQLEKSTSFSSYHFKQVPLLAFLKIRSSYCGETEGDYKRCTKGREQSTNIHWDGSRPANMLANI